MKISIIVPVYNAEKSIKRCVDSIEKQNFDGQLEVVLVEDYSEDQSLECCYKLSTVYDNIIVVRTKGKGVSEARNTGLENITGEIIGFCDSDDEYAPNIFKKICNIFNVDCNINIVIGGFFYSHIHGDKLVVEESHFHRNEKINSSNVLLNLILNDSNVLGSVCNKFYRRDLLKNEKFPEEISYCEDLFFNAKIISKFSQLNCLIIKEPIYHYIRNLGSATNNTENLFDSNLEYKYIATLKKIYSQEKIPLYKKIEGYKIVTLAIDFLYHNKVSLHKKEKLMNEIKMFKSDFIKMILYNIPVGSFKWFIKYIIVLIKTNYT